MTRHPSRSTVYTVAVIFALTAGNFVAGSSLTQTQQALRADVQNVLTKKPIGNEECRKQLTGAIETTNCDYETVESVNDDLFENLHSLVTRPFFKYFKVDLYRECPFWDDPAQCSNQNCGVEGADESKIPVKWRAAALSAVERPGDLTLPGCYSRESDFCFFDDANEGEYVDLARNPERFTGYSGDSARRVWSSIYNENCFGLSELNKGPGRATPIGSMLDTAAADAQCLEKRVYYRVVSGLHASISTHICWENMIDQQRGEWGPDLGCFISRVASNPERLQNIYFNTVLMLRALSRSGPYLKAYDMCSGDEMVDDLTRGELDRVINLAERAGKFDESLLFRGEDARLLKHEFKDHFRNVSRIMDCVGCDKCRLWGKVQVTGVATALKILFELDDKVLNQAPRPEVLQRSELVALVNTLHRFSESLHAADFFRKEWAKMDKPASDKVLDDATKPSPETVALPPLKTPILQPTTNNETIIDAVLKACEKSTAVCLRLIAVAVESVSSFFQPSAKYDGPTREL